MRARGLVAVASFAAAGCHQAPQAPTHVRPTVALLADARPAVSASTPPPEAARVDGEAEARVARMLVRVAQARELAVTARVEGRTLARSALIAQVRRHVEKEVPHEVIRAQGELLLALGLVPPAFDFERGMFALLEAQLAGYYEPADKTMYMAADLDGEAADATLAHELVHALQDQHYDLGGKLAFRDDNGDVSAALQCLAEGDAMSAMYDVVMGRAGAALEMPQGTLALAMKAEAQMMPSTGAIPPVLKSSLVAPYIDGTRFVNALRTRGGWSEVDKAWKRPPVTTEQLLHVDKYDANEPAMVVPRAPLDAVGGGFTVAFSDLMGEQSLRITFEEWAKPGDAERAAAGWGGDRISLLSRAHEGGDEHLVVWWIRFDGVDAACRDATEAFGLIAHAIQPSAKPVGPAPLACTDRPDLGPLAVARSGCDVVVTAGPYGRPHGQLHASGACSSIGPWLARYVRGGH